LFVAAAVACAMAAEEPERVKKDVLLGAYPITYGYDDGKYFPGKYERPTFVAAAAPAVTTYAAAAPAVATYAAAGAYPYAYNYGAYPYSYNYGAYPYVAGRQIVY
jgi:pimeloyl-ACP methyl ester carboxylesterase